MNFMAVKKSRKRSDIVIYSYFNLCGRRSKGKGKEIMARGHARPDSPFPFSFQRLPHRLLKFKRQCIYSSYKKQGYQLSIEGTRRGNLFCKRMVQYIQG